MKDFDKARSFVFYESYMNSIEELEDKELKLEVLRLIIHYGIEGTIVNDVSTLAKSIFRAHQYNIDNAIKRRKTAIENGKNGGAPKGNNNASKERNNQKQPNSTKKYDYVSENNLNDNVNVNENVNVNDNVYVNAYENENEDVNENGIVKGKSIDNHLLNDNKALQKIANETNQDINKIINDFNYLISNQYIIDNNCGEVIKTTDEYISYKKGYKL